MEKESRIINHFVSNNPEYNLLPQFREKISKVKISGKVLTNEGREQFREAINMLKYYNKKPLSCGKMYLVKHVQIRKQIVQL